MDRPQHHVGSAFVQHNGDASDFRRHDPRFHGEALTANLGQVHALNAIAADLGITSGRLALAWLLAQGNDIVPIPGTRDPSRVDENAAAADIDLTPADLDRLEETLPDASWAGDRRSFAVPVSTRTAGS
ncbi:MAG: aldo/keto reductase [Nocardioidaceae bacterium]